MNYLSDAFEIRDANQVIVRTLDYNPNKPHQIASAGDDCSIRIWDLRNTLKPMIEISHHTHW